MKAIVFAISMLVLWGNGADAADLGATADRLVIVDDPVGQRTQVRYKSSRQPGIQTGTAGDPTLFAASLEIAYTDQPCHFTKISLPAGVKWQASAGSGVRYMDRSASRVSATIRPAKLASVMAKTLGDDQRASIDLSAGGLPSAAGGLTTILTVRNGNDGTVHRMCTKFATNVGSIVKLQPIRQGQGLKLTARKGMPINCASLCTIAMDPDHSDGFFSLPWPNDIRMVAGHIDLTGFPGSSNALVNTILTAGSANTAAFGTNAALFFQSSVNIDPATLPSAAQSVTDGATAMLVNLDDPSAARIPLLVDFRVAGTPLRPPRLLTLLPYPGHPLTGANRYAAILFNGIASAGYSLTQSPLVAELDDAWNATKPVDATAWAALQAQRNDVYSYVNMYTDWSAAEVVAFTVFTTQNPVAEMEAIVAAIENLPAPTPISRTSGNCAGSPGANRTMISGSLGLPKWQQGDFPYMSTADGGGIVVMSGQAVQQGTETVAFELTLPCGSPPANGWPILLFMDGTGASANVNDIPYLGINNASSPGLPYVVATIAPLYSGDRYVPGLPIPYNQSEFLYFNYLNPLAGRTNQLQQASEMIYLRRVIEGLTFSPSEAGTAVLVETDDSIVVIAGHSQGALTTPHVLAVDPSFTGGFISAGGGGLYNTVLHRGDIRPLIDFILTTPPGELDMFHPVVHVLQVLAEGGDAANYAPHVDTAHVLSLGGKIDGCSPLEVVSVIGTAMGLSVVNPQVHPMFGSASFEPPVATLPVTGNLPGPRTGVTVELNTGHFGAVTNPDLGRSFVTSLATGAVPTVNVPALFSDSIAGCPRYDPLP